MGLLSDLITAGTGIANAQLNREAFDYSRQMNEHLTGAQQEQNAYNAEQAALARQYQADFYNQYQSPDAMVKQYQAAGLNPALMFAKGASSSTPPSSPAASSAQAAVFNPAQQLSDFASSLIPLAKMAAEIDNIRASSENLRSSAGLSRSQTLGQDIQNAFQGRLNESELQRVSAVVEGIKLDNSQKETILKYLDQQQQLSIEVQKANISEINARVENLIASNAQIKATVDKLVAETNSINSELPYHLAELASRVRLTDAQTSLAYSDIEKNAAAIAELNQRVSESVARIRKINADADISEQDLLYYVFNHTQMSTSVLGTYRFSPDSDGRFYNPNVHLGRSYHGIFGSLPGVLDLHR